MAAKRIVANTEEGGRPYRPFRPSNVTQSGGNWAHDLAGDSERRRRNYFATGQWQWRSSSVWGRRRDLLRSGAFERAGAKLFSLYSASSRIDFHIRPFFHIDYFRT
jgi:hypothetical protein